MNYVDIIVKDLRWELRDLPPVPDELLAIYAFMVLRFSTDVTMEDIHDAWSCWKNLTNPFHPSLVPFEELPRDKRLLEAPYADAVYMVAQKVKNGDV